MDESSIRIIDLEALRVAAAHAFGESPEEKALAKMYEFAEENGLLEEGLLPATFGFNNPNPSAGSPNYGYEVWLPVADNINAADDIRILDFSGGLYAVTRCDGLQNIGQQWLSLAKWREGTKYAAGKQQWLEHLLSPHNAPHDQLVFDLYLPIAE